MGLRQRLRNIRYPKDPPADEKLITKDSYKKFDTMGVVERVVGLFGRAKIWMSDSLWRLKLFIRHRDVVLYFKPDGTSEAGSYCSIP